ncbi:MAG: gamma-glutamylcyclotransferase [Haloarculaceae archaeon]
MDVFVYGTLTDRATAARILPDFEYTGEATLSGFRRVDGQYPTLIPGGSVAGRLLRTDAVDALDRYEGVDEGLYVRVSVPRDDPGGADGAVETYVGDPDRLGVDADWPGDGPFPRRARSYVEHHDVRVSVD